MSDPTVSVVIPTLNREQVLCDTLDYFLTRETHPLLEVIVVDQTERHEPRTARYLESVAGRIEHVRATYKSLPRARNDGLARARGDIVLFVDDDVQPRDGFVAAHVKPYVDPKVWMVTGPSPAPGGELLRRDQMSDAEYAQLLAGQKIAWHVDFDYVPCDWAAGCNFSVRRDAARRVGGFDENFIGSAIGEDAEFSGRIKTHGGLIYYATRAFLIHLQMVTGGCRSDVGPAYVKMYAYNQNYFYRKIGASRAQRLAANWRSYRQFVLNKDCLFSRKLPSLQAAFVAGVLQGLRRPLAELKPL